MNSHLQKLFDKRVQWIKEQEKREGRPIDDSRVKDIRFGVEWETPKHILQPEKIVVIGGTKLLVVAAYKQK